VQDAKQVDGTKSSDHSSLLLDSHRLAELQANKKGPPSSFEIHSEQVFLMSVSFRVCRN